ncbi:MAG TPA: ABC transporter permease [Ignavibacteriaceae bacterium]|nr:ABC transporter permease [Ignavibacteriaceae bacterium]
MSYENFIAKRYLLSKHKINFITVISFISIAGITLGVAALIVVLSVFNGFGSLVTSYLMNFDPHLRVEYKIESKTEDDRSLKTILSQTPDLKAFAPFVSGKVLAISNGITDVVTLKGIRFKTAEDIYGIKESILYGTGTLKENDSQPGVIIGLRLADKLQTLIGDTIAVVSPSGIEKAISQFSLPNTQKFIVKGIFNSQNNEYDSGLMFTSIDEAQYLLGYGKSVQGYEIKLNKADNSFKAKDFLSDKLDKNTFEINTWYDFHRELYSVMQIERWVAYILLSLIIAVATFNILGSLSMSVIEKKRDIGILRSMGSKEDSILKIFMYEGLMIGLIGTGLGILLGYFVCFLQINYNIYPLDPTQYKIDSLPMQLRISDFFIVAGASIFLSFIASLIPARRAAKVDALQAIKWE